MPNTYCSLVKNEREPFLILRGTAAAGEYVPQNKSEQPYDLDNFPMPAEEFMKE